MKFPPALLLLAILLVARTQSVGSCALAPGVGAAPGIWRPANNSGLLMAHLSEARRPAVASTPQQGLPVYQPDGTAGGTGNFGVSRVASSGIYDLATTGPTCFFSNCTTLATLDAAFGLGSSGEVLASSINGTRLRVLTSARQAVRPTAGSVS